MSNDNNIDDDSMPVIKRIHSTKMRDTNFVDDMKCVIDFKSGIYISFENSRISLTKKFSSEVLKRIANCDFNSYVLFYLEFEQLIDKAFAGFDDYMHKVSGPYSSDTKGGDTAGNNNTGNNKKNHNKNNNNSNNNNKRCLHC